MWTHQLLNAHGRFLKDHTATYLSLLRGIQRSLIIRRDDLSRMCVVPIVIVHSRRVRCEENMYTLKFLSMLTPSQTPQVSDTTDEATSLLEHLPTISQEDEAFFNAHSNWTDSAVKPARKRRLE